MYTTPNKKNLSKTQKTAILKLLWKTTQIPAVSGKVEI